MMLFRDWVVLIGFLAGLFLTLVAISSVRDRLEKTEATLANMNINVKCYCDGKLLDK